MTVFWLVVLLFVAGALMFVMPALWQPPMPEVGPAAANLAAHRAAFRELDDDLAAGLIDGDRHGQARRELQQRLLEDVPAGTTPTARPARRTALVVALLLPLVSLLIYLQLGRPEAAAPSVAAVPTAGAATSPHALGGVQIEQRVSALAERLQSEPRDADGWITLGRSYTALGRYGDAAAALRKAVAILPPDAGLLADLADITGMAQGRRLAGEPARLVQRALDLDPRHVKALALAGSVSFEVRDYAAARGYWERILPLLPAESPILRSVRGSLAEVTERERNGEGVQTAQAAVRAATPAAAQPASRAAPAAAGTKVSGTVVLDPALASQVPPGATLFIFARAAQGPRIPLAVLRQPAQGGPWTFTLDDSMAMAPGMTLSAFPRVVIGARISGSGNATPQAGDLVGESPPLSPGPGAVQVRIDHIQP